MKKLSTIWTTHTAPSKVLIMLRQALFLLLLFSFATCQKIAYTTMEDPAYLRVFNNLNPLHLLDNKGDTSSYLCMLINPVLDNSGMPVNAGIVGDHLDKRDKYAPPYPSHIGVSTSVHNPEYPGKENVLAGPVLNGFDLSSWAQVPSGKIRIMFMYRPKNDLSFFDLDTRFKQNILKDTLINLKAGEVYTLHVLLKDFVTKEKGLLLRQENFHKRPLSDSLIYMNFYNYSAKGYVQADYNQKVAPGKKMQHLFEEGIRDTMNIFLTLNKGQDFLNYEDGILLQNSLPATPGYVGRYLTTLYHDHFSERVNPYMSFPLWVRDDDNGIHTNIWQRLYFLSPGMDLDQNSFDEYAAFYRSLDGGVLSNSGGHFAAINFLLNGPKIYDRNSCTTCAKYNYHAGINFPNLIVSTHSGQNNPQSFATVNTVEIVNGQVYLSSIQRRYAPPIY